MASFVNLQCSNRGVQLLRCEEGAERKVVDKDLKIRGDVGFERLSARLWRRGINRQDCNEREGVRFWERRSVCSSHKSDR